MLAGRVGDAEPVGEGAEVVQGESARAPSHPIVPPQEGARFVAREREIECARVDERSGL